MWAVPWAHWVLVCAGCSDSATMDSVDTDEAKADAALDDGEEAMAADQT